MSKTHDKIVPYRSHPWHGLSLGENAPFVINCYIEIVPTDSVKYELDKETGLLKVDRPQKYSSYCPALYGLLPQTYAGKRVGQFCAEKIDQADIQGDGDPLDVLVLTEKTILRGDIILSAIPIGGFRLIDGDQADDKIIAVMVDDLVYGDYKDISDCADSLIERLKHYFLTYKDAPGSSSCRVKITDVYGAKEAHEIINLSKLDYLEKFFA